MILSALQLKPCLAQSNKDDKTHHFIPEDNTTSHNASPNQVIDHYQRADLLKSFNQQHVTQSMQQNTQLTNSSNNWQATTNPYPKTVSTSTATATTTTQDNKHITVFLQRYIFFECDKKLQVIDAKALHTTWVFQQFNTHINANTLREQPLLVPVQHKLNHTMMQHFPTYQEQLKTVGITAATLDVDTIVIRYIPALLHGIAVPVLIDRVLNCLSQHDNNWQNLLIQCMSDLAGEGICNASLHTNKAHTLINQLAELTIKNPPFVYSLTPKTLASWFHHSAQQQVVDFIE